MSDKDTTYNGWRNYETWAVALWIDNEEPTQRQALSMARVARRESTMHHNVKGGIWTPAEAERYELSDALQTWVSDEMLPDLGATLAADLLGAAVSEVDWQEIADHYLADVPLAEPDDDDYEEEEEEGDDCSDPAESACGPEPEPTDD